MFIVTELIKSELLCLLLRWPYGQSTIGSHYELTPFIQVRATKTILTWDGMGEGGGWWWETGGWQPFGTTVVVCSPFISACIRGAHSSNVSN